MAALTLGMQRDALRLQEAQAQLGFPPAALTPHPDETLCVVCIDAPIQVQVQYLYSIPVPTSCMHMCACGTCAQLLWDRCPVCRGPIEHITQVFT